MKKKKYEALDFGPLPVDVINRILEMELEPGIAHMSGLAHKHAAEKHPTDYLVCHPLVSQTIADPTFVGQAPKHRDNFELIRRVPGGDSAVLVAVSVDMDDDGRYRVRSYYLITEEDVTNRREKRYLKLVQK